jgi:hypothetical protein
MNSPVRTVGTVIFLSPIALTAIGFMACAAYPTKICLAVPFAWMLLWPAYIVGAIVFLFGALGSRKQEESLSRDLGSEYSTSAKIERQVQPNPTGVQQMQEYGISFDGERYSFGEYRYEKLADAINYAKRQNKSST